MSVMLRTERLDRVVATVIRVYRLRKLVGSVLLNGAGRTLRRTPDLKDDVVVKVLCQFARCGEESGTLLGRDGRLYAWLAQERDVAATESED
jgi:hypothetical protein